MVVSEAAKRISRTYGLSNGAATLRYVTGRRKDALERLGLHRVRDVLLHIPHRYLDFTTTTKIGYATLGSDVTVIGTVDAVTLKRPRPRMQIVEVLVLDETGAMRVSFFRQPWVAKQIKKGDVVAFSGTVTFEYGYYQMRSPFFEVLDTGEHAASFARILPVHPVGEGVSASWMRRIVSAALSDAGDVCDPVPAELIAKHELMSEARALREVHFPASLATAEFARRRLAYDELLTLQLALLTRKSVELAGVTPTQHTIDGPCVHALKEALPFELTHEQEIAAQEILDDMASNDVMNRLLLGDVGTGKTAVAAVAIAAVADTGSQAAMMAPTSVLARQYAEKMGNLFDAAGVRWALVTGATPPAERAEIANKVRSGELCCVFGTTALLSDDIEFRHLSLVVIDEQHRFGVNQRLALRKKGAGADLLTMSATPIPRTLALSLYGDIACSRIRHRPRPGAGVETKVIPPENCDLAFGAIRDAVAEGRQAYVICPLVDERDKGTELDDVPLRAQSGTQNLHAATATIEQLSRRELRGLKLALLTGRMTAEDKDATMDAFRRGEVDVLVATTVVEVGVDVPNATVMLVYDADRFGLATLHQLRGRVGRGDYSGKVFLECAAGPKSPSRQRLAALEATSDGYELAELDLGLRREGEVLGYRQHGGVSLKICDLVADADLVEAVHGEARAIARQDPGLRKPEHALLALECRERYGVYFEEVRTA